MTTASDQSVAGDNDHWMLFERLTSDGYPIIVLARTGNTLVESRLRDGNLTVVRCRADASIVNDNGLPRHTDHIYPVEDILAQKLLLADVGVLHAASISGDGERRMVYAHANPLNFAPMLEGLAVEDYALSAAPPTDRAEIIDLITPTVIDVQLNGDRDVISNLEKRGDDCSVSRKTDFWFYGAKDGLQGLAADLEPWGYSIDHWLDDTDGVVLTSDTPVEFGVFREITPVLVGTAEKHDVTYDGWETFVVSKAKSEVEPPNPQSKSLLSKLFGAKKN
jgi:regulator of RNase E activity RraB